MLLALAIILIVWFTEIPLWVSIICTVFAGVTAIVKLGHSLFDNLDVCFKDNNGDNDNGN